MLPKQKKVNGEIVVCSVPISPIRNRLWKHSLTWIDLIVSVPVHTFAVDARKIPLDPLNPQGYWYCAGDFCDIYEPGVDQDFVSADIDYANCLVAPDIKDDHKDRPAKVIAGVYNINYVCHNITNRILYATDARKTIVDLDISINGYANVVKSKLGVYGQNKYEWKNRKRTCTFLHRLRNRTVDSQTQQESLKLRAKEIEKIHLRACGKDREKATRLTEVLKDIDEEYYQATESLIERWGKGKLNLDTFNFMMVKASFRLFGETAKLVGEKLTQRIYPDCFIEPNVKYFSYLEGLCSDRMENIRVIAERNLEEALHKVISKITAEEQGRLRSQAVESLRRPMNNYIKREE